MKLQPKGLVAWLLLAFVPACAGKSTTDGGTPLTSGGSSHEGGATSVAGASASGGSGATAGSALISPTTACPAARPESGSACNYIGVRCNYDVTKCSSVGLSCTNGVWLEQPMSDGSALSCLNYSANELGIPKDGDSCACRGRLDCTFDECDAQGRVHAVCDDTTWHVSSEPCADAPCGPSGLHCKPGEACVARGGGVSASYECAADPCAAESQTLSCGCAASLCDPPSERCVLQSGLINCVCDTC